MTGVDPAIEAPRPVMEAPATSPEYYDEDNQPHGLGVGWALSWGCQLTIGHAAADSDDLHVTVSTSDEDQRKGITVRSVTVEQVRDYAYQLLALAGVPPPDVDVLDRLRGAFEQAGATERAWGAHYAAMVMRGQLRVEDASTGPSARIITGRYHNPAAVTDEQAREQAAAAMRRVADVFARNRSGLADAASLWAQGFEGFDSAGQWPVWLEAARALLGVSALPEEDRRHG